MARPTGIINAKVKSIGGCTGRSTATNYGISGTYELIGYAGKVNGCATTVVYPSILSTHNRHIGIGNYHSGNVCYNTVGNIASNPYLICAAGGNCDAVGICTSGRSAIYLGIQWRRYTH